MTESHANDDLKAKMREALDRKNDREQGVHHFQELYRAALRSVGNG